LGITDVRNLEIFKSASEPLLVSRASDVSEKKKHGGSTQPFLYTIDRLSKEI